MTSVSSENIYKCLYCLTALKGVLEPPPDREIVSPRPDLRKRCRGLEEGMSEALSWISRALVRRSAGDVAAVAWVQPVRGQFRLLFSNNNESTSPHLKGDEDQAKELLKILKSLYEKQHGHRDTQSALRDAQSALRDNESALRDDQSALRDNESALRDIESALRDNESALRKLQDTQTDELMQFVCSHDSAELAARKMGTLIRLRHRQVDDFDKERKEMTDIFRTIINRQYPLDHFPSIPVPELSDGEKWLATYVGYVEAEKPTRPSRADLMQHVFDHIVKMNTPTRNEISGNVTKFRNFVRFCQEVRESLFMREADEYRLTADDKTIIKKLRRRLNRLASYLSGARAIVTDLFEYFHQGRDKNGKIELTLDMVAKSFPDKKRKDSSGMFKEGPRDYLLRLLSTLPDDERTKLVARLMARLGSPVWNAKNKFNMSYHAELRLILYSVYVGWDLDIIGVSKLPCYSCFLFLQRLAKHLQEEGREIFWRFSSEQCSWKAHFQWGIPSSQMTGQLKLAQITARFVKENFDQQFKLLGQIASTYTDDDYPVSGTDSSNKGSDRE
ncbi:hypothetical protein BDZ89DRAFT_1138377 [Hymenopellis radicata]|nr:hypothetical protein BDZ89DRAFT_1138377 [Hymenopellis radicata]